MIDTMDRKILELLQVSGRMSNAEIARTVNMAPSGTFERIRKLEERQVVLGYGARVNPKALGLKLTAFVFVRSADNPATTSAAEHLAEIEEVQEVHHIAGEDCYLIKVRARDTEDLQRLLRQKIGAIPEVRSTRTTIVLQTVKESTHLPMNGDDSRR